MLSRTSTSSCLVVVSVVASSVSACGQNRSTACPRCMGSTSAPSTVILDRFPMMDRSFSIFWLRYSAVSLKLVKIATF